MEFLISFVPKQVPGTRKLELTTATEPVLIRCAESLAGYKFVEAAVTYGVAPRLRAIAGILGGQYHGKL
jgi:hypothetical protein